MSRQPPSPEHGDTLARLVTEIDQSFVQGIGRDGNGGAIAQAIVVMAHSLGLAVTAEGIERGEQAAFLEAHGCDRLQGYLVAEPMAASALENFLAQATSTSPAPSGGSRP